MRLSRRNMLAGAGALAVLPLAAGKAGAQAAKATERIYANPLRTADDVKGFVMEGEALVDFDTGRMRLKNARSAADGQASNFVYWCPETFPDNVEFRWNFWPLEEPGLAILLFAAQGLLPGGDPVPVLDKRLKPRAGIYAQYTNSDVSALTMAYFRRRWPSERAFHLCNLRRAPGFEMLAQGADPIPDVADAALPYKMRLQKRSDGVDFFINDLLVMAWKGGGVGWPASGSIGFRQMAPLVAAYSDFEVWKLG
ncbi:DUF1961 family protein [Asticcacaulis sp. EMRT-3]|uniref:DUF1961 family protein n=1 Tax=Asticcacaulis sp. EMRT-3 TaxID=3040349 RepID=UPI0024AFD446|nr:DUF1961 family protein [Asticcacaulis sp. EMRT-3]MDI7776416.1 DUF1961 family protein [Asticcacaulis sp. EMRT-3]